MVACLKLIIQVVLGFGLGLFGLLGLEVEHNELKELNKLK
jgi:hypothetical protein